jgi:hypothetical protein
VPNKSHAIFDSDDAAGHSRSSSDAWFENERAMWWAEFDSVGEEAVRGYVERNAYTSTGMEVARQWLARHEFLQLRREVQSIRALSDEAGAAASRSLKSASEAFTLARQVDANTRAIVESAAAAKQSARTMAFVGVVTPLIALCAIVMVLWFSRHPVPNTEQALVKTSRPKQAIVYPPHPLSVQTRQALATPPGNAQNQPPTATKMESPVFRRQGQPLSETRQASAITPESAQKEQQSNTPRISAPDPKPEGQSVAEAMTLIADQVGGEGAIVFTAQVHDMATGRDHTEQLSYRASNVTIDPNRCQMAYRWHVERDGTAVSDQDRAVDLRLAKSIRVTSVGDESGRRYFVRTYPTVYVVHITRWDSSLGDHLYFRDKDMAARIGTASRQAAELCDNGEQEFRGR